jgi:nucleotide-binding universal stress UspA family protein
MISSILVAVDTSAPAKAAATYTNFLCYKLGATLAAVYVKDSRLINMTYWRDYGAVSLPSSTFSKEMDEMLELQGQALLAQVKMNAEQAGVTCRTELRMGIPPTEILAAAQHCDLIVLGRQGETTRIEKRQGLGAVAERVLRTATQPVLVTPGSFEEIRRVVLGYDGSERAREAMTYAVELAQRLNLPVLAVSVHDDEALALERLSVVERYAEAHQLALQTQALQGDPADALLGTAEVGDLIAMGAFGEGRIREWLLGSTTEAVLRASNQPVLLHR